MQSIRRKRRNRNRHMNTKRKKKGGLKILKDVSSVLNNVEVFIFLHPLNLPIILRVLLFQAKNETSAIQIQWW